MNAYLRRIRANTFAAEGRCAAAAEENAAAVGIARAALGADSSVPAESQAAPPDCAAP